MISRAKYFQYIQYIILSQSIIDKRDDHNILHGK